MGWSTWYCYGRTIDQDKVLFDANALVQSGLIDHGWTYINIDDKWEGDRASNGQIKASPGFPDTKGMADQIHHLGLKVSIYSSPGTRTCAGALGYQEVFVHRLTERYAEAFLDSAAEIRSLATQKRFLVSKIYGHFPNTYSRC